MESTWTRLVEGPLQVRSSVTVFKECQNRTCTFTKQARNELLLCDSYGVTSRASIARDTYSLFEKTQKTAENTHCGVQDTNSFGHRPKPKPFDAEYHREYRKRDREHSEASEENFYPTTAARSSRKKVQGSARQHKCSRVGG